MASNVWASAMNYNPISVPVMYSNGYTPAFGSKDEQINPWTIATQTGYQETWNNKLQTNVTLEQDFSFITKGLKFIGRYGFDTNNYQWINRKKIPELWRAEQNRASDGSLVMRKVRDEQLMSQESRSTGERKEYLEAELHYDRTFGDHIIGGVIKYTQDKTINAAIEDDKDIMQGIDKRHQGLAGRFTYGWKYRYFVDFNFGYNGSENFAPGKRYGFFPSYAVGYMISNEKFWEPLRDKVNILKIRASYGKIGNDEIGGSRRFAYNTTMNTNAGGFTFGDLGQTNLPGYSTGEYGNPDVAWEEATKADVGIELGLFNKIKIQADYFYEKREGIFIQRESTPSVVGTKTAQWVNLGRMKNQGFDMSLEFDHSFNKDFSISARGNFTYNRNKKLYDDKPDQIWKYQNLAGFANNQQFGLIAEGLFESEEDIANWPKQDFGTVRPGDIKYRDVNGDGVVNTFDKVAIGYTLVPEINYGFGASVKWKGIDVSVFFSGVGHVTRIIQGQNLFGASSTILRMGQIFEDVAKNRWTLDNQNPNAPYPRLSLNKVDNNQQLSTYWQRDMSFMRLKDAEIGYTLPESMTKKWGLSKIRFYIQGKNLVTFSDFKLWDPEVNANYGNVYPLIRTFAIGANVNF